MSDELERLRDEVAAKDAEIARLREDHARMEWLSRSGIVIQCAKQYLGGASALITVAGADIRKWIDAAIAAAKEVGNA